MEPKLRVLPVGFRFRPTDCEISKYFLTRKALGQPMNARNVPEECHDIFSRYPRDLPGYHPREKHWYFYCRKLKDQVTTTTTTTSSHNIWTQIEEETDVLDAKNNDALVGIKRPFTLVEKEDEESDDIFSSDEEEPPKYNWFMDEISLPLTVADTDWVFCHVFRKKIKPETVDSGSESEEQEEEEQQEQEEEEEEQQQEQQEEEEEEQQQEEEEEEEEEESEEEAESVAAESLDLLREKDGNVLPPSPSPP